MRQAAYTVIDHTADLGLSITAPTLESLFETAATGLFDQITDLRSVLPREERRVAVSAPGLEEMLVRWLAELLFLHDVEGLLLCRFAVAGIGQGTMEAAVRGEVYDPRRHPVKTEVKAITYHRAAVERLEDGWRGLVVIDV
ncbi:MAG TPA: archease [Candidatus Polarisedimenticolia bacterium]|nr:archease [Candidatus Polarisedimenticolia bacterium]